MADYLPSYTSLAALHSPTSSTIDVLYCIVATSLFVVATSVFVVATMIEKADLRPGTIPNLGWTFYIMIRGVRLNFFI